MYVTNKCCYIGIKSATFLVAYLLVFIFSFMTFRLKYSFLYSWPSGFSEIFTIYHHYSLLLTLLNVLYKCELTILKTQKATRLKFRIDIDFLLS